MNKVSSYLWGLVLIAIGVILGINALGIADIDIFFPGWWTLFIIVPCTIGLFDFRDKNKTGEIIGIVIGVILLLGCLDVINFSTVWQLILPTILIIGGLSVILHGLIGRKVAQQFKKLHKSGENESWATFSSQNIDFSNREFKDSTLEAVFGSIKCDLRKAKFAKEASLKADATFGSVTIYVPEDVEVEVAATQIFGGVTDKRKYHADKTKATLYVNANCLFGGVEIRNA